MWLEEKLTENNQDKQRLYTTITINNRNNDVQEKEMQFCSITTCAVSSKHVRQTGIVIVIKQTENQGTFSGA